jgi:hypothetical protein
MAVRTAVPALAVTVTLVAAVTLPAVAEKAAVVPAPGIVALEGAASAALLVATFTVRPSAGAAAVSPTVQETEPPAATLAGVQLRLAREDGAATFSVALRVLPLNVAVIVAVVLADTAPAVAVKVVESCPAAIETGPAALMGPLVPSCTDAPPAGAPADRATVHVVEPDELTVAGLQLKTATASNGSTVTVVVRTIAPALAVSVTVVDDATVPAVTVNDVEFAP